MRRSSLGPGATRSCSSNSMWALRVCVEQLTCLCSTWLPTSGLIPEQLSVHWYLAPSTVTTWTLLTDVTSPLQLQQHYSWCTGTRAFLQYQLQMVKEWLRLELTQEEIILPASLRKCGQRSGGKIKADAEQNYSQCRRKKLLFSPHSTSTPQGPQVPAISIELHVRQTVATLKQPVPILLQAQCR